MSNQLAFCFVSISPVRAENRDQSEMVTQLLFGEVVEILEQTEKWTFIQTYFDNYKGWVDTKHLINITKKECVRWLDGVTYLQNDVYPILTQYGVQTIVKGSFVPNMVVNGVFNIGNHHFKVFNNFKDYDQNISASEIALDYLNTPYLWGGKTPFGIDCSGLIQMVFRFLGVNLPRDASQQVEYGNTIDFEERMPGDVMFFQNEDNKVIHVGILLNENDIIHASGHVKINQYDQNGIIHEDRKHYTHHFHSVKRIV